MVLVATYTYEEVIQLTPAAWTLDVKRLPPEVVSVTSNANNGAACSYLYNKIREPAVSIGCTYMLSTAPVFCVCFISSFLRSFLIPYFGI